MFWDFIETFEGTKGFLWKKKNFCKTTLRSKRWSKGRTLKIWIKYPGTKNCNFTSKLYNQVSDDASDITREIFYCVLLIYTRCFATLLRMQNEELQASIVCDIYGMLYAFVLCELIYYMLPCKVIIVLYVLIYLDLER